MLGAGLYGARRVFRLQQRGDTILSENVASIRAAEELETIVREVRYRLKRYLETRDPRQLNRMGEQLPAGERSLRELHDLAKSTREEDLAARMDRGYRQLKEEFEELAPEQGRPEFGDADLVVLDTLADEVIPNKVLVSLQKYVEHNEGELARSRERNQANARSLMLGLLLLGGGGGVAGLLAGILISRRISHTIVQLSLPLQDTAGKLNEVVGPVTVSGQLGFADLQSVLQTVSERVATVVERFHDREREVLRSEQLAAVGQLAAGMAHELRNPLTAVKAVLQLAENPDDLSPRDLQVINEEVNRLEQSVQRFLDFARPPNPEKRRVELGALIHECTELLSRRVELKGVRLEFERQEGNVFVIADASQLRQVFLNLILNGCDAASRGGLVRVSLDECSQIANQERDGSRTNGSGVNVVVSDTGPGLPPELGSRIFDPFVSTKETGLGLGLSICRRIVEAHGGTIEAVDASGGGTQFWVWIPSELPNAEDGSPEDDNGAVGGAQRLSVSEADCIIPAS